MRLLFLSAATLILCYNQSAFAGDFMHEVRAEAIKHHIPPSVLESVCLVESENTLGNGRVAPWPLTIRADGTSYFFKNTISAAKAIDRIVAKTDNVDIGLCQINLKFHRRQIRRFGGPVAMLNPTTNLKLAATLLEADIKSTSDLELGVGRYHSWTSSRARRYGKFVLRVAHKLKNAERK